MVSDTVVEMLIVTDVALVGYNSIRSVPDVLVLSPIRLPVHASHLSVS